MQGSTLCHVPRVLLRIGLLLSLLQHCHNASLPPDRRAADPPRVVSGITTIINFAMYKRVGGIDITYCTHYCMWEN